MITLSATTLRCDNAKHVFLSSPAGGSVGVTLLNRHLNDTACISLSVKCDWSELMDRFLFPIFVFNRWNISMVNWSRRYPTLSSRCYLQKLAIPRHQPVPGVFLWSVGSFQDVEAKPPDYNAVSSFLYLETVDLRCKMEHAIASDCITANLAKTRLIVSLCLPDGGRVRRAR